METYSIVRFFAPHHPTKPNENQVIQKGLTLEEAQEHCRDPDTRGDDWFDGYRSE